MVETIAVAPLKFGFTLTTWGGSSAVPVVPLPRCVPFWVRSRPASPFESISSISTSAEAPTPVRVVVGRLGRAHGVRGDLSVDVRTDEPERRFAPGSVLHTDSLTTVTVEVESARWHSGHLLVHLVGIDDRTAAEAVRGLTLEVDVDDNEQPDDPDEFYDRHLIGLRVELVDGTPVGTVADVLHLPAHDMLAVMRPEKSEVLVPFISEMVPSVDRLAGVIAISPPPGLLEDIEADTAP